MQTILLIFSIGKILLDVAPEVYEAFMKILAAIPHTPEVGNPASLSAAKTSAKAIMPVLDTATRAQVQTVLDNYDNQQGGGA